MKEDDTMDTSELDPSKFNLRNKGIRASNGKMHKGELVRFVNTGNEYYADEVGVLKMDLSPKKVVEAGDVGYIITGIKEISGDGIVERNIFRDSDFLKMSCMLWTIN